MGLLQVGRLAGWPKKRDQVHLACPRSLDAKCLSVYGRSLDVIVRREGMRIHPLCSDKGRHFAGPDLIGDKAVPDLMSGLMVYRELPVAC